MEQSLCTGISETLIDHCLMFLRSKRLQNVGKRGENAREKFKKKRLWCDDKSGVSSSKQKAIYL
jgi:hypothetical protein